MYTASMQNFAGKSNAIVVVRLEQIFHGYELKGLRQNPHFMKRLQMCSLGASVGTYQIGMSASKQVSCNERICIPYNVLS